MQQGFMHFHAACNHQRHLMIAVECLLRQLEDQKNGVSTDNEGLRVDLMEQIVHLSQAMTVDMEKFTWTLFRHTDCPHSIRQFKEIEGPCHQMLDANLCVVNAANELACRCGCAPWITRALANAAARTQWIHAQMHEYTAFTSSSPVQVQVQVHTRTPV